MFSACELVIYAPRIYSQSSSYKFLELYLDVLKHRSELNNPTVSTPASGRYDPLKGSCYNLANRVGVCPKIGSDYYELTALLITDW